MLHTLKKTFEAIQKKKKKKIFLVTGETPPQERFRMQNEFQTHKGPAIWIGNLVASGTNLTLTASSEVLFIEESFVPSDNAQAADRAHRYGQTACVNCRHVAIAGSIDEKIANVVARKTQEMKTYLPISN